MTINAKKGEKGDSGEESKLHQVTEWGKKPWENLVLIWQMNEHCMVTKIRVDAIIFTM